MVLIEAMAFGLPIVATDCERGPRELLGNGRLAEVAEVDDPAALANGLLSLIRAPARCRELGAAGRKKAEAFDRHDLSARWWALANGA